MLSVAGFFAPFISPEWFVAEQIASSPLVDITQNTKMVAYQLGNIYILLAMIGVAVLYTTTEARVVRNYLIALAIADVSHVGVTWYAMGHERAVDVASWNSMTWGNIGVTVSSSIGPMTESSCNLTSTFQTLLFVVRLAYLTGLFGPDQQSPIAKKGGKLH